MRLSILALMALSLVASMAAAEQNPFSDPNKVMPPMPDMTAGAATVSEQLPASFTDNRTAIESMELVAYTAKGATIRYLVSGATREIDVKDGASVIISGRQYKVAIAKKSTSVSLTDKNGVEMWNGGLVQIKTQYVTPSTNEYQYVPPVSAGAYIGQSRITGAASIASGSPASPQSPALR